MTESQRRLAQEARERLAQQRPTSLEELRANSPREPIPNMLARLPCSDSETYSET